MSKLSHYTKPDEAAFQKFEGQFEEYHPPDVMFNPSLIKDREKSSDEEE